MKQKFLFLLFFFAAILASLNTAQAQRVFDFYKTDTITDQDTITVLTTQNGGPSNIDVPYYYSVNILSDSLSGANAGTVYLQVSNDRNGTVWYNAQTLTLDGATQQTALYEGILYARRMRVYIISPAGTRSTKVQVYGICKRVN